MAVLSSEMKAFLPATVATSFSTASVGGAISATEWNGTVGQLIFTMAANEAGGADLTQYAKLFIKNTNSTDTINSYGIWIANALDEITSSASAVSLVSSSASDTSSTTATVQGFSSGGAAQEESITLNGTTTVTTTLTFLGNIRVTLDAVAVGDITVTGASALGEIPAGYKSATAEIEIGAETSLGGSTTIADASTAPSGVTFSVPRTEATKITLDNGTGTLEGDETNAVWIKLVLEDGFLPKSSIDLVLRGKGDAV